MFAKIIESLSLQQGTPRSEEIILEGVTYRLTADGQHVEIVNR